MLTIEIYIKAFTYLALITLNISIAQSQCRYRDSIFAMVNTVDVSYGANVNFGAPANLVMRIYRPNGDVQATRPAILLIHGGGFNTGNYVDPRVLEMCRRFTIRGYVTATIAYRLYTQNPINYPAAIYKAVQDVKAAIRFMRGNASSYGIDPQKIFLHGFSAGGFIGNQAAYWDYAEVADSLKTAYGNMEASGNPGIIDTVSGVMAWAGGIMDTAWLSNETVPWGSVHNSSDAVVPYWGEQGNYGSGSINQYRQNHSLPSLLYTVDVPGLHTPDLGTPEYNVFSAYSIDFIYRLLPPACITLPILLSDFTAEATNGSLRLKWSTSPEINSLYFNVEKSSDGINFYSIGRLNAASNNSSTNRYSFTDSHPIKGTNYYRLQQVDKEYRSAYSETVKFDFNPGLKYTVVNPVNNKLIIHLMDYPSGDAAWRMYNMNGQTIYFEKLKSAVIEKNTAGLSPGVYTVEILTAGKTERIKLLKK